ncbi:MAG: hypothetical protein QOD77_1326 [Thermoplasmata archaeon]|jgi:hypothetical protein|nr:hypothetical protein [Thermoplasmata archaeon]
MRLCLASGDLEIEERGKGRFRLGFVRDVALDFRGNYHVQRLAAAGQVTVVRDGRAVRLHPAGAA